MEQYLASSEIIDWQTPSLLEHARDLAIGLADDTEIAQACFEWVRDQIRHSWDHQLNPVTCKASDVLRHGTGYCYAKSHLLAALLRANGIPTGLCYQRLSIDDQGAPYCLHGLNAIHLRDHGWYRVDARGNNKTVSAEFTPPREKLAFPIQYESEADLPGIWPEPLPQVVSVLNSCNSILEVYHNLPDVELHDYKFAPTQATIP